ncbi:5-bromo-4-chloroindolyl phosphate hydrolysis protein [Catenibacillus scindens]|uniref:5-bromo-4-chloroindolyl phosphate hydrolysis protein n=1 Tax=Catenibacillus scindens TaxID=673271 RepID=A0A7W8HCW2_9FIRM|nr:5-bromo-4-chloroindolyl phosphate hydrolysis protein [Catenibacillus scindens]
MKFYDILAAVLSGILFLVLFLGLGWNLFVAILLAVGIYFALSLLLRPRKKIGGVDVELLSGGEAISAQLEDARKDLRDIRRSAETAVSPEIRQGAFKLAQTGENIIACLEKDVDKISVARRFLNYYLDTAVDILNKYCELQQSRAPRKEMEALTQKSIQALNMLNEAFERQHSRLIQGDLMDIESDIELLKKTLKMEEL